MLVRAGSVWPDPRVPPPRCHLPDLTEQIAPSAAKSRQFSANGARRDCSVKSWAKAVALNRIPETLLWQGHLLLAGEVAKEIPSFFVRHGEEEPFGHHRHGVYGLGFHIGDRHRQRLCHGA